MSAGPILPYRAALPLIAADVFLAANAAVIGDVEIGAGSSVWFAATVRGDVAPIRIGARSNIQDGAVIHGNTGGPGARIGDGVTVGHAVILHECTLDDSCLIGMGSCVMDGAIVESGAMVAAGSLLTPGKRVRSGELWSGSPARLMRPLTDAEVADITESASHYAELAARYRDELRCE